MIANVAEQLMHAILKVPKGIQHASLVHRGTRHRIYVSNCLQYALNRRLKFISSHRNVLALATERQCDGDDLKRTSHNFFLVVVMKPLGILTLDLHSFQPGQFSLSPPSTNSASFSQCLRCGIFSPLAISYT